MADTDLRQPIKAHGGWWSRPVSRVLSWAIIHLGPPSPTASSDLPGSPCGRGHPSQNDESTPLFGLAPGGVYRAAACYQPRGALLPHHFTLTRTVTGSGGIFSVALSVGSRPPGITWHPVRRSPDFPPETDVETLARAIAWPAPGATIDQALRSHKSGWPANPRRCCPSICSQCDMRHGGGNR